MSQQKYEELVIKSQDYTTRFDYAQIPTEYGRYYKVATIEIVDKNTNNVMYKLQGKPFSRFMMFLNIGKRKFIKMVRDSGIPVANNWLAEKYPTITTEEFKLLLIDGQVVRLTSSDYIGIPHSFVQETIETRLKTEGIEFEKKYDRFSGMHGMYVLKNTKSTDRSVVLPTISYFNKNSGDRSLKLFGGGMVLVCSNGMVSNRTSEKIRLVHKLQLGAVKKKIEEVLGGILEKLETLPQEFLKLQKIQITQDEAKKKIEELPVAKYLKEAITTRLFKQGGDWDNTLWGLYMSCTFVGTHYNQVQNKRQIKDITEDHVAQLQSIELVITDWGKKREVKA